MGALFKLIELMFHLVCYHYFHDEENAVWFLTAEVIWFGMKMIATEPVRPSIICEPTPPRVVKDPLEMETAEWLNLIILRLWIPINRSLQKIFREELADLINKEVQKTIPMTFEFVKLDLGTIPFEVLSIKSYMDPVDKDEIRLDVDVSYHGDASFVVRLGYIQAGRSEKYDIAML